MDRPALLAYKAFWSIVDWVYPPVCAGCGHPGEIWCQECLNSTHYLIEKLCPICGYPKNGADRCLGCCHYSANFTEVRSLAAYTGGVKNAIHRLKYQNDLGVGSIFADMLKKLVLINGWKIDIVVPIPLSKQRKKERGYNQARILALPIALKLGIPLDDNSIIRTRETSSQVSLDAIERQKNIHNAFSAQGNKLRGKNILIVDDVITTGSTINDCARAGKIAGVKEVFGVSLGRAILNELKA
jgi:competence protein ComFC